MYTINKGSRFWRRALCVAGVAVVALTTACGSSNTTKSGGTPSSGASTTSGAASPGVAEAKKLVAAAEAPPTSITQTATLSAKPPTGKHVIYLNIGLPAAQQIVVGMKAAVAALGWTMSSLSVDPSNPASLQAALKTALAQKPDFVVETGLPQSLFGASTIAAYQAASIPIIITSTAPFTATGPIIAGNPDGPKAQVGPGKAIADWFVNDSNGKGNALVETVTAYPVLAVFVSSFNAEVSRLCPDCKTKKLEITANQVAQGQVVPAIVSQLRSDPSIKYLIIDNAEFVDGLVPALKAAGLSDVRVGGRSIDQAAAAALNAGTELAWTGTPYQVIGMSVLDIAVRHLLGVGGAADNENHPFQMFTSDNAKDLTLPYNLPANALDQYKKLWGLS
jgi:ribose transport system substrate-binding protein